MLKKLLCISPNFPPVNAPDLHRLRQSLPYFSEFDWQAVVFSVEPEFLELRQDKLLLESVPDTIEIIRVKAFSAKWTRKVGLGNVGFRAWFQYRYAVDEYLKKNNVDLIYFTTTVFTLMSLGPHWKKKFGVPFVVDLQDPWRNDYYLALKKENRPRKFWFDYQQKKILEKQTIPKVSGIVSVSRAYIDVMKSRYSSIKDLDCLTLPFAALELDWTIAKKTSSCLAVDKNVINIVYIGRAGGDMEFSISILFQAFKKGLREDEKFFSRVRFSFFGTSYAADGLGVKTVEPLAIKIGISKYVKEHTDRLPYFQSLNTLASSDVIFVPGSVDDAYTASKIFPYILARKPLLAIFNEASSIVHILRSTNAGEVVSFSNINSKDALSERVLLVLKHILDNLPYTPNLDMKAFAPYSAREMTKKQCIYFDRIISPENS